MQNSHCPSQHVSTLTVFTREIDRRHESHDQNEDSDDRLDEQHRQPDPPSDGSRSLYQCHEVEPTWPDEVESVRAVHPKRCNRGSAPKRSRGGLAVRWS